MDEAANPEQVRARGLCAACRHAKVVTNDRGSEFVQCVRAKVDPRYRKYPVLPVLRCEGYEPA